MGSEFFSRLFAKITLTPFTGHGVNAMAHSESAVSSLINTLITPWRLAGSGPAAAYFLLRQKVSKKAIAQPLPAVGGFPNEPCDSRMGHKLASLKHVSHNSRLSPVPFGNVSMRKVKNNVNGKSQFKSNVKNNVKNNVNIKTSSEKLNGVGVFFRGSLRKLL
ncbi:hypothetical protein ACIPF8_11215 [Collimonas sp. NPDC087041]|uniref:hypothetical protein n=1 Tax=Collimonas sp. NPDC087041 TaxID=3363960 RepID=UPI0037FA73D2